VNSCGGCWLLSGLKSVKCLHLVEWQKAAADTESVLASDHSVFTQNITHFFFYFPMCTYSDANLVFLFIH